MADRDPLALPDLDEAAPSGENVELDPDFAALEQAAQGKPETQQGDPAVPPDWKEAESLATGLLRRTRDLRVLVYLATARLHRAGVVAFADTLTQIRDQIEARWDEVHPKLDPEDDLDPTWRKNALRSLADQARVLPALRNVIVASTREGQVSWRDIAVFVGQLPADPARPKLTEAAIRGSFAKTDPQRLTQVRDAVDRAGREAASIVSAFEAHAGAGSGPNLDALRKLLQDMASGLRQFEPPRTEQPVADDAAVAVEDMPEPTGAAASGGNARAINAVTRREDALYLLDLAAAYFRANEPSSPLPLLIDRARRLATMDFLDILRDLAPNGLEQAQMMAGSSPPEG
jgi:type VI secretion system protein ImpA